MTSIKSNNPKLIYEIKKMTGSQVEISGELPANDFENYRAKAIEHVGKDIKVPGFRKGHIPSQVLIKKVGESTILEEMANNALRELYPKIFREQKLDAIGRPEISITKLAVKNPFGFKIKTAVMPEIKLPDYKAIAKKEGGEEEEIIVTDEDIEKTILEILKVRRKSQEPASAKGSGPASPEAMPEAREAQQTSPPSPPSDSHRRGGNGEEGEAPTPEGVGKQETEQFPRESALPKLDDALVQSLGHFKNVADFKAHLKKNLRLEKEIKARDKRRLKIIESILDNSEIDLPQILVDVELGKMIGRLKHDLSYSGLKLEAYLKKINKTENDLRKEWEKEALKRAKIELIIHEVSIQEHITPDESKVEEETGLLLEKNRDANPKQVQAYIRNVQVNEKVFQFLESLADR